MIFAAPQAREASDGPLDYSVFRSKRHREISKSIFDDAEKKSGLLLQPGLIFFQY
jgi:hypothetical protein